MMNTYMYGIDLNETESNITKEMKFDHSTWDILFFSDFGVAPAVSQKCISRKKVNHVSTVLALFELWGHFVEHMSTCQRAIPDLKQLHNFVDNVFARKTLA